MPTQKPRGTGLPITFQAPLFSDVVELIEELLDSLEIGRDSAGCLSAGFLIGVGDER